MLKYFHKETELLGTVPNVLAECSFTKKLEGRVKISGSKNASLAMLAATLLTDEECIIKNVPRLDDVFVLIALLEKLGKKISFRGNIVIIRGAVKRQILPEGLSRKLRASVLVMGPILASKGSGVFALPGGCALGERPIDIHIMGLRAFGARYEICGGKMNFKRKILHPAHIHLPFPSVGATENILMAASLIPGKSVISNVAREPEIINLVRFLNAMGSHIKICGSTYEVYGVRNLHGAQFSVMPDRIESGTFLLAAAAIGGAIKIIGAESGHLTVLIKKLAQTGVQIGEKRGILSVKAARCPQPADISTAPYPGFPTDLQPLWAVYMLRAAGKSKITEKVFPARFMYVDELKRLGADMKLKASVLTVGKSCLNGAHLIACDLRAAAAMIIAGLMANGTTRVGGLRHLFRGYENFFEKLQMLKANVSIRQTKKK